MRLNRPGGRVREIRPKQHAVPVRESQQRPQRVLVGRERGIKVELSRVFQELGGAVRLCTATEPIVGKQVRGARGEERQRAAGVGQDDLDAGVAAQGAARDEVDGRAARFVGVVDDGLGEAGVDEGGIGAVGRVYEDDGGTAVELFPQRGKGRVAQVAV